MGITNLVGYFNFSLIVVCSFVTILEMELLLLQVSVSQIVISDLTGLYLRSESVCLLLQTGYSPPGGDIGRPPSEGG